MCKQGDRNSFTEVEDWEENNDDEDDEEDNKEEVNDLPVKLGC